MTDTIKRHVHGDYFDYTVEADCTVMKVIYNRKIGSLVIKSKGNNDDESWHECLKLTCSHLSRCGLKNFAEYAKSVIGIEIWDMIKSDVPND